MHTWKLIHNLFHLYPWSNLLWSDNAYKSDSYLSSTSERIFYVKTVSVYFWTWFELCLFARHLCAHKYTKWHSAMLVMLKYKLLCCLNWECTWLWISWLCLQIYRKTEYSQSYRYQTRHVLWFGNWHHVVYHLQQLCYCVLVWCNTYLGIKRQRGSWIHTSYSYHCK
jgi:hypothetical protein